MNNTIQPQAIHPNEYEQASNGYLMAVVAVMGGLPLPIINLIASFGYYLAKRKASNFIRWHAIQAVLAQLVLVPFNSLAWAWSIGIFIKLEVFEHSYDDNQHFFSLFNALTTPYIIYMSFIILFNTFEFFAVIYTAARVRKGHNVRWLLIANITDRLCSKEKRDIYNI
ncbi:DUF4870 domain-containing protein [Flavobacterium beibuense]|uniref:DUF4870 domain-containing protein n=1 Tax=Flavobacterium beibuense TaxID=657326 RepID=A0A444WAT3_9FLAO|nr:DUF4870 domain-containing protein [Flavobacterium beibuense]RYJ42927.1 hypothetical protein NU09_2026 [Flavobacterium beibuense]